jgi:hypothetical protein
MVKFILIISSFLVGFIANAQVSENRNIGDFSKLKASQGIEVLYTVSNSNSVKVETDDKERLKMIKTEVDGETLKIFIDIENAKKVKSKNGKLKTRTINGVNFTVLKVYVTGKALTNIKASSSASIKLQNVNATDKLEIAASSSGSVSGSFECVDFKADVSSSGDVKGKLSAKSVYVEVSSSGDVTLDGKATSLEIKASSSGDCDLRGLTVQDAIVKASSSSDVTITVTKSLDAAASSSADIDYYGNPAQVKTDKSSSGSINRR